MPAVEPHILKTAEAVPIGEKSDLLAQFVQFAVSQMGAASVMIYFPGIAKYWCEPPSSAGWPPPDLMG
jgi:hypothetical protein